MHPVRRSAVQLGGTTPTPTLVRRHQKLVGLEMNKMLILVQAYQQHCIHVFICIHSCICRSYHLKPSSFVYTITEALYYMTRSSAIHVQSVCQLSTDLFI